jgi:hypothetical protein
METRGKGILTIPPSSIDGLSDSLSRIAVDTALATAGSKHVAVACVAVAITTWATDFQGAMEP